MFIQSMKMPAATNETRLAAQYCLQQINHVVTDKKNQFESPINIVDEMVTLISEGQNTSTSAWLVGNKWVKNSLDTSWPIWFNNKEQYEKPLFYFINTPIIEQLEALSTEANYKGIFLNCIDGEKTPLPKGVYPWFPLMLATKNNWLAYDVANAQEATAIIQQSLIHLYFHSSNKLIYIALHQENSTFEELSIDNAEQAFKGMYRVTQNSGKGQIHLCGAGKSLARVLKAAELLKQHWRIGSEIWSCPSYTRLAREAQEQGKAAHLSHCLTQNNVPVVAVTDYPHHIADQLKAHISNRFLAIGSDSQVKGETQYPQA